MKTEEMNQPPMDSNGNTGADANQAAIDHRERNMKRRRQKPDRILELAILIAFGLALGIAKLAINYGA